MKPEYISPDQTTEDKIAWAEVCYQTRAAELVAEKDVRTLCRRLSRAIRESREQMRVAGVAHICRRCAELEGGSCCGSGLERNYDGWLLLINLLLGVKLREQRPVAGSCFFLGEAGCRLLARHTVCINYICKGIENGTDPRDMAALRGKEGEELTTLFLLNERLKKVLRP
jgi:hypothetical protein